MDESQKAKLKELLSNQEQLDKLTKTTHKFEDTGRTASSPADLLEAYTTGPLRTGIAEYQSTDDILKAIKAATQSMGKDPANAPQFKRIMETAGISGAPFSQQPVLKELYRKKGEPLEMFDIRPEEGGMLDVSPAGLVGGATDLVVDPINLALPGGKTFGKGINVLNPALHREAGAKSFAEAVENARKLRPDVVENVSKYTPEEYSKMRPFLSPDKKSGFALKPTDKGEELINVFSAEKGLGRGDKIVSEAVNRGAQTLDSFDSKALRDLYEKHGFKEFKREPNFTPGGPDVVYRSQPGNPKLSADEMTALKELQLPPELRRTPLSMEPAVPTEEGLKAMENMAKEAQYSRVMELIKDRQKKRAKFIDQDTDVLVPKKK